MTVQNTSDFEFETGLEDFDMADAVIPRLTIDHKKAVFKDGLSGEEFETVNVIFLGLVKQRSLWHTDVEDGDWPMCRSGNYETGFPDLNDKQPRDKMFPWEKSGFDKADYPPGPDGLIRLPCANCQLKEWKTHPDGKKPFCTEQFTLPVLYDPRGNDSWVPAIMTFQKTSMKGVKAYLTSFARQKGASFQAVTEITLTQQRKGSTDYCVPNFKRIGDTEPENWREYSTTYRTIRDFLEADPGSDDIDGDTPSTPPQPKPAAQEVQVEKKQDIVDADVVEPEPEAPPVAKGTDNTSTPVASAAPVAAAAEDDDGLPF